MKVNLFFILAVLAGCSSEEVTLCDGSNDLKIVYQKINKTSPSPNQSFHTITGSEMLVVDGQCRYWVRSTSYLEEEHHSERFRGFDFLPVRTGELTSQEARQLSEALRLSDWRDLDGTIISDGGPHDNKSYSNFYDDGFTFSCSTCSTKKSERVRDATRAQINEMYANSEYASGPLWISKLYEITGANKDTLEQSASDGKVLISAMDERLEQYATAQHLFSADNVLSCATQLKIEGEQAELLRSYWVDLIERGSSERPQYNIYLSRGDRLFTLYVRDAIEGHEDEDGLLKFSPLLEQGGFDRCE